MSENSVNKGKYTRIIIAYPFVLILIGLVVNYFFFEIEPVVIAMPERGVVAALTISALILLGNHTWLMTSTELTRLKYNMHATPEEWDVSEHAQADVSPEGAQELERQHNAHRNATENTVYFVLLAVLASVTSPSIIAAQVWFLCFAIGRLGHTFSYLSGRDGLRGVFMSISLVSLYGLGCYLLISVIV